MLRVIDCHVHFWDPAHLRYTWLEGLPALNRAYLPDHVPSDGPDWAIDGIVFVQADCAPAQGLAEADWVAGLAEGDRRIRGIVAFAPLEQGERARPALAALAQRPLVKGVRRLIQDERPGFCLEPDFVAGVRAAGEHGFRFDLCIRHWQLTEARALMAQCPDMRFVLDHLGKPDVKAGRRDPWWAELGQLAALPNVACKLSGLVTEAEWERWRPADLRPYLDRALEVFGIERVMYGSDAPVAYLASSYERWIETLLEATAGLSEVERERVFAGNARDFYGIGMA